MRFPALLRCFLPAPILIACVLPACSQALPAPTVVSSPAKTDAYPDEAIVILHSDNVYTYAADGTCVYERTVAARVQSDAAVRSLGVVAVEFAANSQTVEFEYARVRHPDGTVVESDSSDAIQMPDPVTRDAPFYSDLQQKQIPIRSLRAGDTLEWKARITTTKPEAPGHFWGTESFVDGAVALEESVELRVPQGTYVQVWSGKLKPEESNLPATGASPAMHVYRWTASQLKPSAGKAAEAEAELKKKQVWTAEQELDADQGKLPSIAWTNFKSWQEVGAWYASLEKGRDVSSPEIDAKVKQLIAGKTTDEDKARALYSYVATQIRYIGVAFGVGRYQPHTAADILANQYGDCKDKHTLLAAMLSAAGLKADAVLIGAGIRFNPDVPSPASFNHMITHLQLDGKPVWLDTTSEVAPYQVLLSVLRDREALVVPDQGAAHLEKTPAGLPFASFQEFDATGSLDKNGISHSRISITVRGDTEVVLRSAFHEVSPGQYNQLVQQLSQGIGYSGTTSNADVTNPDDTSQPFRVSYDYEREKAGDWDDLKIIPQVAPVVLPRYGDSDPLVRSADLGLPRVETSKAEMKLPEGWTAVLPFAVHYKCPYFNYDETYRFDKGTVYTERRVEVLKEKVPTSDLKTYKACADKADLGDETYIQLVKHEAAGAESGKTTPPAEKAETATGSAAGAVSDADVVKMLQDAYQDANDGQLKKSQDMLNRVAKASPDHEYYWSELAYLEIKQGEMEPALEDFQKELTLHPNAYKRVYPSLVNLQLMMSRRKDAEDTLRAWMKTDPDDSGPVVQLMGLLSGDHDSHGTIEAGEAALAHFAQDSRIDMIRTQLGSAYLEAGDTQKGVATLKIVLTNSHDAGLLNDAAYSLADKSLELPADDAALRTALRQMEQESNTWTLDEDPRMLASKSMSLVATWDSMGWVLFREGKLDEARSYLAAGWRGEQNLATAQHVGELLLARGDKAGALRMWELGIAATPNYNSLGVHTEPGEEQKKLQAKVDALRRSGVRPSGGTSLTDLLTFRVVSLGPANGRSGTAEYRLLLRNGKVVKAELTGTKTVPGIDADVMKASYAAFFPKDEQASLVRTGMVNCHQKVCELVLEP